MASKTRGPSQANRPRIDLASHSFAAPAFGKADLSNCEREAIHLAGSIQPHGALLVVGGSDHTVIQCSANAAAFLDLPQVLGRPLAALQGDLLACVLPHMDTSLQGVPVAIRCHIGERAAAFDGLLHRPPGGGLVIELEHAGPAGDLAGVIAAALETVRGATSLRGLCDAAATLFQDCTGYDRVMVYRFDDEGHGEVFSERRGPELEAFLGNRYPSSDIPQMARRLYERIRVRMLVDVNYVPVPLQPRLSPLTGQDLDMSSCVLRSMSPIHLQYLKNMGVGATLVASLMVGGKLWGLVACHHYAPRVIHFELRAVCELLAEAVATRIAALESFAQSRSELFVQRLEQRMIEAMSRDGDWRGAIHDGAQSILQPLGAIGCALIHEDRVTTTGDVPATQDIRAIAGWLDLQPRGTVIATASLGLDAPEFAELIPVASGVLAVALSDTSGEYLIWFRPERIRTVTWGGDPAKPFTIGSDPRDLSPRRSFAQWHQQVEGTSDPWTPADLAAGRLIGQAVADIVLQFRAVRTLIAQDQLERFSSHVRICGQPLVIADHAGRILLANDAIKALLPAAHSAATLHDLTEAFAQADALRQGLSELVAHGRPWRGELRLRDNRANAAPLMLRADPVQPSRDRVLGFVLIFTDLADRKAAEGARSRFQEGILDSHRLHAVRLDSRTDLIYQNLLAAVVENAQLAALEITYGVETARIAGMLESVRLSTLRTAEVLERLIHHAAHS